MNRRSLYPDVPAVERYFSQLVELKASRVKNLGEYLTALSKLKQRASEQEQDCCAFGGGDDGLPQIWDSFIIDLYECARKFNLLNPAIAEEVVRLSSTHKTAVRYG